MSIDIQATSSREIEYPESDGEPIADNTRQFEWIATIKGGLDGVYRGDPNVFVAGDLLWYPVEGNNIIRTAPDAMVVFGRPKGHRGSYMQWREGHVPPQVTFEILSPNHRSRDTVRKHRFYERYGVEEYYEYDPDSFDLAGWLREGPELVEIPQMDGWVSPRLGIRFDLSQGELQIFGPDNPFLTYVELIAQREHEQQRAEHEQQRAEHERQRAERLAHQLRALGIEPQA